MQGRHPCIVSPMAKSPKGKGVTKKKSHPKKTGTPGSNKKKPSEENWIKANAVTTNFLYKIFTRPLRPSTAPNGTPRMKPCQCIACGPRWPHHHPPAQDGAHARAEVARRSPAASSYFRASP